MKNKSLQVNKTPLLKKILNQKYLIFMSLPFVIHIIIFKYFPLFGWLMAFQEYKPGRSLFKQVWVGLDQFKMIFKDTQFLTAMRNTLAMSTIKLVFGTFFAILVAVLIHETRKGLFKRSVKVISCLPYFISWVVAANLILEFLAPSGFLNQILLTFKIIDKPILWMGIPKYFWWIIGWSYVWKSMGFGAIIYLSAMTSINTELYEAAYMDGAGRMRCIWHITLPGIKSTFVVLLIINIGHLLEAGFEHQYLLKNGLVQDYAEVFNMYVLRYGFKLMRFSYAGITCLLRLRDV